MAASEITDVAGQWMDLDPEVLGMGRCWILVSWRVAVAVLLVHGWLGVNDAREVVRFITIFASQIVV